MAPTTTLAASIAAVIDALGRVSTDVEQYRALDDRTLLELARLSGVQRQLVDAHASVLAGEIERVLRQRWAMLAWHSARGIALRSNWCG